MASPQVITQATIPTPKVRSKPPGALWAADGGGGPAPAPARARPLAHWRSADHDAHVMCGVFGPSLDLPRSTAAQQQQQQRENRDCHISRTKGKKKMKTLVSGEMDSNAPGLNLRDPRVRVILHISGRTAELLWLHSLKHDRIILRISRLFWKGPTAQNLQLVSLF